MSATWVQSTAVRTLLSLEAEGCSNQEPRKISVSGLHINRSPGEPGTKAGFFMRESKVRTQTEITLDFESTSEPVDLSSTGKVVPDAEVISLKREIVEFDDAQELKPGVAEPSGCGVAKIESCLGVLSTNIQAQFDPFGRSVSRASVGLGPALSSHEISTHAPVLAVPPTHERIEGVDRFDFMLDLELGTHGTVGLVGLCRVREREEGDEGEKNTAKHGDYPWVCLSHVNSGLESIRDNNYFVNVLMVTLF